MLRIHTSRRRFARRSRFLFTLLAGAGALSVVPAALAIDTTGDPRQSLYAGGFTVPGEVAAGPGDTSLNRALIAADEALGVLRLVPGTDNLLNLPTALGGTPISASQLAVQDGHLYVVDQEVGIVRIPWSAVNGAWDVAAGVVITDTAFPTDRPVSLTSDEAGNLYSGFITTGEIVKIASPSDAPVVTRNYANTSDGGGAHALAFDGATNTLYVAEGSGLATLVIPDPPGDSAGTASPLEGVTLHPAGGIALDADGLTWPADPDGDGPLATTKNLLVGTAQGIEQINLTGSVSGAVPLTRRYARGLANVSGLHLLTSPLDAPDPLIGPPADDYPAGTLLAGEDPSAGADGAFGQYVAIRPGTPPANASPAMTAPPSHPVLNSLTTPADLAWDDNNRLWVTDHMAGPVRVTLDPFGGIGSTQQIFNSPLLPYIPGLPMMPFDSAGALAFDQFGHLYFTDNATQGTASVWKVPAHPQTRELQAAGIVKVAEFRQADGRSLQPDALAIDKDGNLYVGFVRSNQIARISDLQAASPVIEPTWSVTSTGDPAAGLEVDPENRLLISSGSVVTRASIDGPNHLPQPWIDIPLAPGVPTLDAPSDLSLAPDALYVLDDLEVIRVPLAGAPDRTPDVAGASVRLEGLNIAGGLVLDEAGRTRPDVANVPNPALFAATDFAVAEGTGQIFTTDDPVANPAYRTPALGDVSHLVVTEPTGVLAGPITPKAVLSSPGLLDAVTFQLVSADGGTVMAELGTDTTPDAQNRVQSDPFDTASVPDGTYRIRAVAQRAGFEPRMNDRTVQIDNVIPPAVFTSPADPLYLKSIQTLQINDSAFVGVQRVQFKVNGISRVIDTAAPFRLSNFNFGSTPVEATIEAIATFSKPFGASANRVVSTGVQPYRVDGVAPTAAITSPSAGAFLQGVVDINATVTDQWTNGDNSVATSDLRLDGTEIAAAGDGVLTASVDTTSLADGTHTITARGTDRAGNTSAVASRTTVVDNVAPVVALGPLAAEVGPDVTLSATATNVGASIASVEFFDGATSLGVDSAAPFTIAASGLTSGEHSFTAVATTQAGVHTVTSPPQVTTVVLPPAPEAAEPPVGAVATTAPGGGALVTAQSVPAPAAPRALRAPQAVIVTETSATVRVVLSAPSTLTAVVTNSAGELVQTIALGKRSGTQAVRWNLKNTKGKRVKKGVYRITIRAVDTKGKLRTVTRTVRVK